MAWTEEAVVAISGSAEAETATAGAREAPTMDYVMKLDHGDVRPFRDVYVMGYDKTIRLGARHDAAGRQWRLGESVCDWVEEATRATAGSEEAVTA